MSIWCSGAALFRGVWISMSGTPVSRDWRDGRRAEKLLWNPTPKEARRVAEELRRRLEDRP